MNSSIYSSSPSAACPAPSRLDAYFDGELPDSDRGQIESHLAICPACREALEQVTDASALVKSIEFPALSQVSRARVMKEMAESAGGTNRWLLPIRLLTAAAAVIFLGATCLIVHQYRHGDAGGVPGAGPIQPVIQHHATPGSVRILPAGATNPAP